MFWESCRQAGNRATGFQLADAAILGSSPLADSVSVSIYNCCLQLRVPLLSRVYTMRFSLANMAQLWGDPAHTVEHSPTAYRNFISIRCSRMTQRALAHSRDSHPVPWLVIIAEYSPTLFGKSWMLERCTRFCNGKKFHGLTLYKILQYSSTMLSTRPRGMIFVGQHRPIKVGPCWQP